MTYQEWLKPIKERFWRDQERWYDSKGRLICDEITNDNYIFDFFTCREWEWRKWINLLSSIKENTEKQIELSHRLLPEHIESTRALYDFTDKVGEQIKISDWMRSI